MNQTNDKKGISTVRIALIYTGCLIGAGFASGKEAWQFFGVFGKAGYAGVIAATLLYAGLGYMTASIAHKLNTADVSLLVNPVRKPGLDAFVGVLMCIFLLVAYVALTAGGGALLESKVGLRHEIGSLIVCLAAILTALGGFQSVSSKVGHISPILLAGTLVLGIYLIVTHPAAVAAIEPHQASKVASHWLPTAIAYVGYNGTAAIPVLGQCAMHSDSEKKTLKGASLGGLILGMCCFILFLATSTDPALSAASSFPMMDLCERVFPLLGKVYAIVLLLAIFMAQTTVFYGFTTKLGNVRHRLAIIWAVGLGGYLFSLYGFSNMVANVYPIVGYISLGIFALEIVNFIKVKRI